MKKRAATNPTPTRMFKISEIAPVIHLSHSRTKARLVGAGIKLHRTGTGRTSRILVTLDQIVQVFGGDNADEVRSWFVGR